MEEEDKVKYCSKCLSLGILINEELGFDYCKECSSTDIREATIEEWEILHNKKYPNKSILKSNKHKNNGREH